eukprot:Trichotokara_eunicae@DN4217_c0_g1_i1.p1
MEDEFQEVSWDAQNEDMNSIKQFIEEALKNGLGDMVEGVHIFGSLLNGFGSKESDLDMCITLKPESHRDRKGPRPLLGLCYKTSHILIDQDLGSEYSYREGDVLCYKVKVVEARIPVVRATIMKFKQMGEFSSQFIEEKKHIFKLERNRQFVDSDIEKSDSENEDDEMNFLWKKKKKKKKKKYSALI